MKKIGLYLQRKTSLKIDGNEFGNFRFQGFQLKKQSQKIFSQTLFYKRIASDWGLGRKNQECRYADMRV